MNALTCDVCNTNAALGVASCSFGAMSLAYCTDCLDHKAEPLWGFDFMFEEVSDKGEGVADWWLEMSTWKDGQYLSWSDYVAQRNSEGAA